MREENLAIKLKKIETELIGLKSVQTITSDGWKLYRYTGSVALVDTIQYFLVFRTDYDFPAAVKLDQESWDWWVYPTGIISNSNKLYFWALPKITTIPAYPLRWGITSSQPGVVSIETSTPS